MGNDESHCNVSVGSDGQSHKTVSTNHNLFEEKGGEVERENSNLKTSFYKDCSLGSVKNLSNN